MVEKVDQLDRGYIRFVEGVFGMQSDESLVRETTARAERYNRKHPDKPLPILPPEQILTVDSRMRETRDRFQRLLTKPDLIPLLQSAVDQAMSSLLGYEQRALQVRFGFGQENQGKNIPLEEVGKRIFDDHQVTRERARQIIAKALRKARHPSRSNLLMGILNDDRLNETEAQKMKEKVVEAGVHFVNGLPPELEEDERVQGVIGWQKAHGVPVTVAINPGTKPPGVIIMNVGRAFKPRNI